MPRGVPSARVHALRYRRFYRDLGMRIVNQLLELFNVVRLGPGELGAAMGKTDLAAALRHGDGGLQSAVSAADNENFQIAIIFGIEQAVVDFILFFSWHLELSVIV